MEFVDGGNELLQAEKEFNNQGKTIGSLLHLTRPILGSPKVVVLDSGFSIRYHRELSSFERREFLEQH